MNKQWLLILGGIVLFLGNCSLAPRYTRPRAPVPADWPTGLAYKKTSKGQSGPAAANIGWREFYSDERLQKVIDLALNNNRDLRIAALNIEKARALYRIQRAELFPTVNVSGIGDKQRLPADISGTGRSMTVEQYSASLGISAWELDFFGRIRNLKKRALEHYLASEQARRSAQISLVAEVAGAYLTLAADRENLKLAQSTLETQRDAYDLIHRRYEVGIATELDLHRAQTQVDAAREDVARYTQLSALDQNALNLLAGSPAPEDLLPVNLSRVGPLRKVSAGLSSEMLLGRPDILQAEHRLKAVNANIGAARADFFPHISLTGSLGTASDELSGLFDSGSHTWNYIPQAVLPIFDTSRRSANLKAAKVEREIAVAQYEKAIQTAFREVADALAVQGTVDQQVSAQQSLVNALAETYRLSKERYTKGIDSYLGVLDAQRSLYAAQQGLITLRLARTTNRVTLYKALGGGER